MHRKNEKAREIKTLRVNVVSPRLDLSRFRDLQQMNGASRRSRGVLFCLPGSVLALAMVIAGGLIGTDAIAAPKKKAASTVRVAKAGQSARPGAGRTAALRRASLRAPASESARASVGQLSGLHLAQDSLALKSSVAFVMDQETSEVLLAKNAQAVLPIASLTKLMTSLVVLEAGQPLDEVLSISEEDIDTEKGSRSRLSIGTQLSRREMLHLALMSSENRAANALGRHFPGGLGAFVAAMNRKAAQLGMSDTRYVEPTGLSSSNQSSAPDLAKLVKAAYNQSLIRELSTSPMHDVELGHRTVQFRNTNGLVRNPAWDIGLQKTGYIAEAGRCLVMQARLAGRKLIMVFLDSAGKYSRIGDAERVRHWLETDARPVSATGGRAQPTL